MISVFAIVTSSYIVATGAFLALARVIGNRWALAASMVAVFAWCAVTVWAFGVE